MAIIPQYILLIVILILFYIIIVFSKVLGKGKNKLESMVPVTESTEWLKPIVVVG